MCLLEEEVGEVAGSRSYLCVGQVRMDKLIAFTLKSQQFPENAGGTTEGRSSPAGDAAYRVLQETEKVNDVLDVERVHE